MKLGFVFLMLLAACAAPPEAPVFSPVAVDMPLIAKCAPQHIDAPPDLMTALDNHATLAQFTKACGAQNLFDHVYEAQVEAALKACE